MSFYRLCELSNQECHRKQNKAACCFAGLFWCRSCGPFFVGQCNWGCHEATHVGWLGDRQSRPSGNDPLRTLAPIVQKAPMDWLSRVLVDARRGWPAYAVVLLLLAAMVALSIRATNFARAEGKPTTAIITSIASLPLGKTYPPRGVRVVASTESGLIGFTHVLPGRVAGCRVGDAISATEVDGSLRLEPWSCERPLAIPQ